ncbi:MAG TPA: glycosyltransferase family 2 protein [Humisphaera sp.]
MSTQLLPESPPADATGGPHDADAQAADSNGADGAACEVSVVIPCLNESDTIGTCVTKAVRALREADVDGEVIVADNGSTDGSRDIARSAGARVVPVARKGYGCALMGGIAAARGRYVVMGDADDSYDFLEVPKFVNKLREGHDIVQGCRLPGGGGEIRPGAMPFLHRWWGNPMFSALTRWWFRAPVNDVYCGLRGFRREYYQWLDLRCTGMEFATEMIIKASLFGGRFAEVPVTLHPDGRVAHAPHLRTYRDGWRTLRFFLMYSPKWLFLLPGKLLVLLGAIAYALGLPSTRVGAVTFEAHTVLFGSLAILCGYQAILFAIFTKEFAIGEGLLPGDHRLDRLYKRVNLERGLLLGAGAVVAGAALLSRVVWQWYSSGLGHLEYGQTMKWVIPGATLTVLGVQTVMSSFFVNILRMRRL